MIKFFTEFNKNLTDWLDSLSGIGSIMVFFGLFTLAIVFFPLMIIFSVLCAGYVLIDVATQTLKDIDE